MQASVRGGELHIILKRPNGGPDRKCIFGRLEETRLTGYKPISSMFLCIRVCSSRLGHFSFRCVPQEHLSDITCNGSCKIAEGGDATDRAAYICHMNKRSSYDRHFGRNNVTNLTRL